MVFIGAKLFDYIKLPVFLGLNFVFFIDFYVVHVGLFFAHLDPPYSAAALRPRARRPWFWGIGCFPQ